MGYPGIFTDKIMDLIDQIRDLSERRGVSCTRARRAELDAQIDMIIDEIRKLVVGLENDCDRD